MTADILFWRHRSNKALTGVTDEAREKALETVREWMPIIAWRALTTAWFEAHELPACRGLTVPDLRPIFNEAIRQELDRTE